MWVTASRVSNPSVPFCDSRPFLLHLEPLFQKVSRQNLIPHLHHSFPKEIQSLLSKQLRQETRKELPWFQNGSQKIYIWVFSVLVTRKWLPEQCVDVLKIPAGKDTEQQLRQRTSTMLCKYFLSFSTHREERAWELFSAPCKDLAPVETGSHYVPHLCNLPTPVHSFLVLTEVFKWKRNNDVMDLI